MASGRQESATGSADWPSAGVAGLPAPAPGQVGERLAPVRLVVHDEQARRHRRSRYPGFAGVTGPRRPGALGLDVGARRAR